MPLFAALLSVPLPEARYPAVRLTPQQQKQQTYDALVAWMLEEAERQPVLVVWEDLHWADPSTLEYLGLLLDQSRTSAILNLLTFRPDFVPPWPSRSHMTPLTLTRLERPQVEALLTHLAGGKALPAEVVAYIVARTDGVPLFVEELTKMLLESDVLHQEAERYTLTGPLAAVAIPTTLQDSLMARLDRLPMIREVAQLGAVLGREFAYEMLRALAGVEDALLQERLAQLVDTELLYQRGRPPRATYIFKHALVQDAAYASLLKSTRQQVHQQVAQMLEARFPDTVATEPELVAHHYTEAGCAAQALPLWQQAGQRALQRSANLEGIEHLTKGLAVLATLPETTERLQHELDLYVALGPALMATKGYASPEVEHTFARAWEFCQQLGEPPQRFPVLNGLCTAYWVAASTGKRGTRPSSFCTWPSARRTRPPSWSPTGPWARCCTSWGRWRRPARILPRASRSTIPSSTAHSPLPMARTRGSRPWCLTPYALWTLGYPDQALRRSHEACRRAEELAHPLTLAYTCALLAVFHQYRRDREEARRHAEAATHISREQGFPLWLGVGLLLQGWACATQLQPAEQLAAMHEGMALYRATDAALFLPYFLTLLAETAGAAGQPDAGLRLLDEAHTVMDSTQERFYEAEVHRVQGTLALAQAADQQAQAETCFHHALAIARRQQAKALELRAAHEPEPPVAAAGQAR